MCLDKTLSSARTDTDTNKKKDDLHRQNINLKHKALEKTWLCKVNTSSGSSSCEQYQLGSAFKSAVIQCMM